MNEKFKKLMDALESLEMNEENKSIFFKILMCVKEEDELAQMEELFIGKPHLIEKVVENYKEKIKALKNDDQEAWQKTAEGEKTEVENLT